MTAAELARRATTHEALELAAKARECEEHVASEEAFLARLCSARRLDHEKIARSRLRYTRAVEAHDAALTAAWPDRPGRGSYTGVLVM